MVTLSVDVQVCARGEQMTSGNDLFMKLKPTAYAWWYPLRPQWKFITSLWFLTCLPGSARIWVMLWRGPEGPPLLEIFSFIEAWSFSIWHFLIWIKHYSPETPFRKCKYFWKEKSRARKMEHYIRNPLHYFTDEDMPAMFLRSFSKWMAELGFEIRPSDPDFTHLWAPYIVLKLHLTQASLLNRAILGSMVGKTNQNKGWCWCW